MYFFTSLLLPDNLRCLHKKTKTYEESIKYQVQLMQLIHEYMCGPGQSVPLVLVVKQQRPVQTLTYRYPEFPRHRWPAVFVDFVL